MFSLMDEKAAAAAIKATVDYFLYGTIPELEGSAAQVFSIMKADIDRNNEKYQKTVERNRSNGQKGGRPAKPSGNPLETKP